MRAAPPALVCWGNTMTPVLLVGMDWKFRALLRGQLIEEGLEVAAYETVGAALATFEESRLLPLLLVADLFASEDPAGEIDQLALWTPKLPVWLVATHNLLAQGLLEGRGFERVLLRPVDLGELVEQIKERVGA
jgi:CheY-like chemotaxis protein